MHIVAQEHFPTDDRGHAIRFGFSFAQFAKFANAITGFTPISNES